MENTRPTSFTNTPNLSQIISSDHLPQKPHRFGLVVIILVVLVGALLFFATQLGSTLSQGSVVFYDTEPAANAYRYSFSDQSVTPLVEVPDNGYITNVAYAPSRGMYAAVIYTPLEMKIVLGSEEEGMPGTTFPVKKGGSIYPAWSSDGTKLSFLVLSTESTPQSVPLGSLELQPTKSATSVPPPPDGTQIENQPTPPEYFASLFVMDVQDANNTLFTTQYPVVGHPIGFSADNMTILLRAIVTRKETPRFSLFSLTTGAVTPLQGVDTTAIKAPTLSPDGTRLAFVQNEKVVLGTIDFIQGQFVKDVAISARGADSLAFSEAGDLLVYAGGKVHGYRIQGTEAEKIGSAKIHLAEQASLLSWSSQ